MVEREISAFLEGPPISEKNLNKGLGSRRSEANIESFAQCYARIYGVVWVCGVDCRLSYFTKIRKELASQRSQIVSITHAYILFFRMMFYNCRTISKPIFSKGEKRS